MKQNEKITEINLVFRPTIDITDGQTYMEQKEREREKLKVVLVVVM